MSEVIDIREEITCEEYFGVTNDISLYLTDVRARRKGRVNVKATTNNGIFLGKQADML